MKKKRKAYGMIKKALAIAMVATMVMTSAPVSNAAPNPSLSGLSNITRYTQKSTSKAKKFTVKLKNISTKRYSITWKSSNPKIAKVSKNKNKTKVSVQTYYRPGKATITAYCKNKKTRKTTKVSKTIYVYQGTTGVEIGDSKKKSIKGKKINLPLTKTFKMSKWTLPKGKVTSKSQKGTSWYQTSASKKIGKISSNTFKPVQKNLIGRGKQTAEVKSKAKGKKTYYAAVKFNVDGGKFKVDKKINNKDLKFKVGVNVDADITLLKGTTITLKGAAGSNVANKTLTAKYIGCGGDKAIYQVKENMLTGKGDYNGTYTIASFVSGAVYDGGKNITFNEDLSENVSIGSIKIDGVEAKTNDGKEYKIVLPYKTKLENLKPSDVKVTPEDTSAVAAVTASGIATNASAKFAIIVTAQNTKITGQYTLVVTKANASEDVRLKEVTVSGVAATIEGTEYAVTLPGGTDLTELIVEDIVAKTSDAEATVNITSKGAATSKLAVFEIKVTAEDGTIKDYTLKVTALSDEVGIKEITALLNSEDVAVKVATQVAEGTYNLELAHGKVSSLGAFVGGLSTEISEIKVILEDENASYKVKLNSIEVSQYVFEIIVKAESGKEERYTLYLTLEADPI